MADAVLEMREGSVLTLAISRAPPPRAPRKIALRYELTVLVPLIAISGARSGDKGGGANIGVIRRGAEHEPARREGLTPEAVKANFAHYALGTEERFNWLGLSGFKLLLHRGSAAAASLRCAAILGARRSRKRRSIFASPRPPTGSTATGPRAAWMERAEA